jgi:hypothetical protein
VGKEMHAGMLSVEVLDEYNVGFVAGVPEAGFGTSITDTRVKVLRFSVMKRFEYGMAYYKEEGSLEAHLKTMEDMGEALTNVEAFLFEAGRKGWEFCALLPIKDGAGYNAWAIFKRPIEELRAP